MKVIELTADVNRDAEAIQCPCGGFATRTETTDAERKKWNCPRTYSCCDRAFICAVCQARLVGSAESPDVDWND